MLLALHHMEEMDSKMQSSVDNNQHGATFSLFGSQQLE